MVYIVGDGNNPNDTDFGIRELIIADGSSLTEKSGTASDCI